MPILQRENYNGWYSFLSYYIALTIVEIPVIFASNFIYISVAYFMTSQPPEILRFSQYLAIIFFLSLAAQGLGLISGSVLNVKYTLIIGSFLMFPFVLFSNFFIQEKDSHPFWHWLFECSFIKQAFDGSVQAIFGNNRTKMICSTNFCIYSLPSKFIKSLGIEEHFLGFYLLKLFSFILIFRVIAFILMSIKIKSR